MMDFYYWKEANNEDSSPFQFNMDTLQSSMFRLSLEDLAGYEEKSRKGITKQDVLARIYNPENRPKTSNGYGMSSKSLSSKPGQAWSSSKPAQTWSNNNWKTTKTSVLRSQTQQAKSLVKDADPIVFPERTRGTSFHSLVDVQPTSWMSSHNQVEAQPTRWIPSHSQVEAQPTRWIPSHSQGDTQPGRQETSSPRIPEVQPRTAATANQAQISLSPRFNWRHLENQVEGVNEQALLSQLSQLHWAIANSEAGVVRQLGAQGLDLGLPLRGVTALSLAVYLSKPDMVKELLRQMLKSRTVHRNINVFSVDNVSRRECPVITAARMGTIEIVRYLCNYGADLEIRDGEGHTALWNAVREQKEEMVGYLVGRGAKVFYQNNDSSCPLQLACKTPLLKSSGKKIARLLVTHGANLEYQDRALRNTLFWVVYNNCRDLTYFVIQSGIRLKPWSWIDSAFLPEPIKQDKLLLTLINSATAHPQKLLLISLCKVRKLLSQANHGKSILSRIDKLPTSSEIKKILKLESARSQRKEDIQKLHRLCSETQV